MNLINVKEILYKRKIGKYADLWEANSSGLVDGIVGTWYNMDNRNWQNSQCMRYLARERAGLYEKNKDSGIADGVIAVHTEHAVQCIGRHGNPGGG